MSDPQTGLFEMASAFRVMIPEMNASIPIISVDCFAGGGGASEAIRQATGFAPVLAVNHSPAAIAMHKANHPETFHLCEDIYDVEPEQCCAGLRIDLAWFSPDCTHFSRAKGGKPVKKEIRGLAWIALRWAKQVAPRVIFLENVMEFLTWGPLHPDDHPDPKLQNRPIKERRGEIFDDWRRQLEALGYVVEWRAMSAHHYGAPTSRKRLFLVARRDGEPIVWPAPTHGPERQPYRTAAECIDWSIPCPSIFERKRPLADKTMARIAEGIRRYVLLTKRPFIVKGGRPIDEENIDEPLGSINGSTQRAVVLPTLIQTGYGERPGQTPRALNLEAPLGTVVAGGSKHALVASYLIKHYGGVYGHELTKPTGTITSKDSHGLVAAHLTKFYGKSKGAAVYGPLPTITGQQHIGLVAAFLLKYYSNGGQWSSLDDPMHTIVSKARMGLVTVTIGDDEYIIADIGLRMLQPRELATAQGFPLDYILHGNKTQQVARIGNSVSPMPARALIEAQFPECQQLAAK